MRLGPALSLMIVSFGLSACSPAYVSRYNGTNHRLDAPPVAPADVRIVKSRDNLTSEWTEVGAYRAKAPTVAEAMDMAKEQCGANGANLYILNVEPYASGGGFRVDGICALRG
jgi:hypothetical protein